MPVFLMWMIINDKKIKMELFIALTNVKIKSIYDLTYYLNNRIRETKKRDCNRID